MIDLQRARPSEPRIDPIETLTGNAAEILDGLMGAPDGSPLRIFATLAHRPDLLKPFLSLGGRLLMLGEVPAREREIVILRVGANAAAEYEFGQHRVIGAQAGLTEDEITRLAGQVVEADWSSDDRALIALADDLCDDDCVSDQTWRALTRRWSDGEVTELVLLAGYYRMVSGFLNSLGVALDDGVAGWPEGAR